MITRQEIETWFKTLQDQICTALEQEDGVATFQEDNWQRPGGGGGRTRVIQKGRVFEKGGVNFSAVHGVLPERIQKALGVNTNQFYATGISIVIHPKSPEVPIIHMNTRYFEIEGETWWFGGGIDLTPIYVNREQASFFHSEIKKACDAAHSEFYSKHKAWADDYFFNAHRKETRGVGGTFFDRLNEDSCDLSKEEIFNYVKATGAAFAPTYCKIVAENKNLEYGERELDWQRLRRGRYVEFNLVYDKGTKFGLETDGRIESILMSLPETAGWSYDYRPEPGSREEETLGLLVKSMDW